MPEKDPLNYSLLTYLYVLGLACWGSVVNYIRKYRQGEVLRFSIGELVGDLVTSGLIGVVTFYLCESADINPVLAAAMVGISGHMGARLLYHLETRITRKLDRLLDRVFVEKDKHEE